MTSWKTYKIGDIIDEIAMGPFGSNIKVDNFIDFGVPVLNGANLQGFKLKEESFNYVSSQKADSLGKANAYRGDIVITHRGTLGQIVYIPNDSKFDRYIISQSQFRVRLNSQYVLPEYFVYYFHTRIGQHKMLMNASQVGVPALARPTSTFKEITIELPPLEEQRRIAGILGAIDDKIENNRRINSNLELQAQALYKQWFVDFEFPNEEGKPYKSSGGKMVDSELGPIPEGWSVIGYCDAVDIKGGGTPPTNNPEFWNGSIPFFTPKDVPSDCFAIHTEKSITEAGLSNCNSKLYAKDTVFITARGTVGKVVMAGCSMAMNQTNYALIGKNELSQYFVYLLTIALVDRLLKKANGAVFNAITTRDFEGEQIVHPTNFVLGKFIDIISPLYQQVLSIAKENETLTTLRDTLLPKLMNGEIKL